MSFPPRPRRRPGLGTRERLFWPQWHQELLALALIITTVAAGWLLAGR
jgi:hypothetical protein